MGIGKFFKAPRGARENVDFVASHFRDRSVTEYFTQPQFDGLRELAQSEPWNVVAIKYREITGEGIKESFFAAVLLQALVQPPKNS